MYAIIRAGGKQYRVQPGDVLRIEKVDADLGAELDLTDVLAIGGDQLLVGEPTVKNAKVTVVVTNQRKAPKIIIFKKKRRQGYRRLTGHRQPYTEVFVKAISSPAGTVTAEGKAKVFDPAKKAERDERKANFQAEGATTSTETSAPKKTAAKAKRPAAKKAAAKGGAKKKKTTKTAKKKTATTKKKA